MPPCPHPERVLDAAETGRPARRHDTFAVLGRAETSVARAGVVVARARAVCEDLALSRAVATRHGIDETTLATLRRLLD